MKRALFLIGGIFWSLFALGLGMLLVRYVAEGAGLQFCGRMFSFESVVVGLVQVVGLIIGAFLCFAVGVCLMARGIVRPGEDVEKMQVD